ncbi:MAG: hypothetical protein HUN05_24095 [Desulfobacter sp.]|nr:MAG: hypothetical protein HUN05_24095 [Desulfobacter sp.]
MSGMIKKTTFVSVVVMALVGNAWGGWFSFEPNIHILDGTSVDRELEDIQKETVYKKNGNTAQVDQLMRDAKVLIIDSQKYETRVEYVKHKEEDQSVFVLVKDESGTQMWANMLGLACQGTNGNVQNSVSRFRFSDLPQRQRK